VRDPNGGPGGGAELRKGVLLVVVLRLKRFGRLNHPTYRVCVADARFPRDGRVIETLGYYLPKAPREGEQVKLNRERIMHWLSVGAQPSETVTGLIRRFDIPLPTRKKRVRGKSKAKPKPFQPPKKKKAGGQPKKRAAAGS
jgi:small subunit ribosomal protein S16